MIPEEFIEELRDRNEITDLVGTYVPLKRTGRNLVGLCPFHNEKTPSFTVYPDTSSFYCFGCQAGGDAITFVKKIENLDYIEALKFLASRAGLELPESTGDSGLGRARLRIKEQNRAAARFFHAKLYSPQGRDALDYFHSRGLSDEIIRHFGLGYSPDEWDELSRHLKSQGFADDEIEQANLGFKNRYGKLTDRFRDRIMFPVIDLQGSVIAFGGRMFHEGQKGGKYINTSDTLVYSKTDNLYAMNFAKNSGGDTLILCEGFMDVIAMHQFGITNAVASQGTAVTKEQARLIAKYAKRIIISQDGDAAGQESIRRSIPILKATGIDIKVVTIPGGENGAKDPDEYIRKFGAERFKRLLSESENDVEYTLSTIRLKHDIMSESGRVGYLKEACEALSRVSDIELDIYASKLSRELAVDREVILSQARLGRKIKQRVEDKEQFKAMEARATGRDDKINPERKKNLKAANVEDTLLRSLMRNPDFASVARARLPEEKIVTSFSRRVYKAILEQIESSGQASLSLMHGAFSEEELGAIARIINSQPSVRTSKAEFEALIDALISEGERMTPEKAEKASADELKAYMETLKRKKQKG